MDDFAAITAFVRTVELKSFTAAADALKLSKAMVSQRVSMLEARLQTRLLQRTTRRLSLTEAGKVYYEHCLRALTEMEAGREALSRLHGAPRGHLRLTAPVTFGRLHIVPALPDFLAANPEVSLELILLDRQVDLVDEGFDIGISLRATPAQHLVARRLAPIRRVLCAAPAYLTQAGEPQTIADLAHHQCLAYTWQLSWRFATPEGKSEVRVGSRFRANNVDALRTAALRGLGIALLPSYLIGPDLAAGRLRPVLPSTAPATAFGDHVSATFLPDRHLLPKVRACLDFLAHHFGPEPYWDNPAGASCSS